MEDQPLDRIHVLQIQAAFQAGFRKCLEEFGKAKPFMSLKQCQDKYGKGITQNWIDAGLLTLTRHGSNTSKWFVSVSQAESVATTYNPELVCNGPSDKKKSIRKKRSK